MTYPADIPLTELDEDADIDLCALCRRIWPAHRLIGGEVCYDCAEAGR